MKYKKNNFIQVDRKIFTDAFIKLPHTTKLLYFYLVELEHRLTDNETEQFLYTDEQLAQFTNINICTIRKAKKQLKECKLITYDKICKYDIKGNYACLHPVTRYTIL